MLVARSWGDKRIEGIIGNLLRSGVFLSAVVVLCGAVVFLVRHGRSPAEYKIFHGEHSDLRSIGGILRAAKQLQGRAIIQLGLLLLVATPVARVAFSVFGFAAEQDRLYVIFAVVVLAVLIFSLFGTS